MKCQIEQNTKLEDGISRRTFVGGAAAAAGFMIVPRHVLGGPGYQAPSDKVNIATIGVSGQGSANTRACAKKYPAVKFHWYDGGLLSERPEELEPDRRLPESGTIIVGEKGKLISETYSGSPRLIPEARMKAYKLSQKTIPRVQGSHEQNWINAIKAKTQAVSNFDYAGPLYRNRIAGQPGNPVPWDQADVGRREHEGHEPRSGKCVH